MKIFFRLIYSLILVYLLYIGFIIASFFNAKIRRGLLGRINLWNRLQAGIPTKTSKKRVWFHVSSAGELEQAKPLLRLLQEKKGEELEFVFTFFSPSALKPISKMEGLLFYDYLPIDTYFNTTKLFDLLKPDVILFVKFDIWPNIVWEADKRGIVKVLIDGTLHRNSRRYSNFIGQAFYNSIYTCFDFIGTVSENDLKRFLITAPKSTNAKVVGDTRFDQVAYRAKLAAEDDYRKKLPKCLNTYKKGTTLICGSTWEEDDRMIVQGFLTLLFEFPEMNLIIVPHEPTKKRVQRYMQIFSSFSPSLFSSLENQKSCGRVLVVDGVGFLAELYKIGDIAYVGGAFSTGVHNVMEPSMMGLTSVFGPFYYNSPEAEAMVRMNCAFSGTSEDDFYVIFKRLLSDKLYLKDLGLKAQKFINDNLGADKKYYDEISRFL
jgi:3-deoxy-D-manno-octulosonic-acid transferase